MQLEDPVEEHRVDDVPDTEADKAGGEQCAVGL
jgi:hypothetical protein